MFKGAFTIAIISGVPVRLHWTFFLLLAWVFGAQVFGGASLADALVAVGFILAVFACVVAHEFGHILAARAFGIRTRDVTLLPIGGVASLERLPEKPWQELVVAIAGPLVNVVIAGVLLPIVLWRGTPNGPAGLLDLGDFTSNFLAALAGINLWLVLFNLIPAFPMDGGRMLRAVAAMLTDRLTATTIAARVGQVLAGLMALVGLFFGLPMLLILAIFVFLGAGAEASGTQASELLRGVPVSGVMLTDFRVLGESDPLSVAVDELLARSQTDFPVTRDGTVDSEMVGVLTRSDLIRALSEGGREALVASGVRGPCPTVRPEDSALAAMEAIRSGGCPMAAVIDAGGRMVGIVTPENVTEAIMVRGALGAARRA